MAPKLKKEKKPIKGDAMTTTKGTVIVPRKPEPELPPQEDAYARQQHERRNR